MRRFILAALVAVTSSVGHAVIFEAPDGSRIEMIVPPPYWVNKKWEGEIMVVGHPANDLTRMCSLLAGKIEILGCAFSLTQACIPICAGSCTTKTFRTMSVTS